MYSRSYYTGRRNYIIVLITLSLLFIAYLWYLFNDISLTGNLLPCAANHIAHIYCPGCGGTRSVESLLQGDLIASFLCHPIVLYTVVVFLIYFIQATYTFVIKRNGKKYYRLYYSTLYLFPIIIILFFFIRNLLLIVFHYDYIGDCIQYWQT